MEHNLFLPLLLASSGNNAATSLLCPGPFSSRLLRSCLVLTPASLTLSSHQRRPVNCDWMPASYTSGQSSYRRGDPICWALLQRSQTVQLQTEIPKHYKSVELLSIFQCQDPLHKRKAPYYRLSGNGSDTASSTLCHGAWTFAQSAHLSTRWERMASQIELLICTRRTTTQQLILQQQKCGALGGSLLECGVVGQHYETPYFHPWHRHLPSRNCPVRNIVGPA